MTAAAGCRRTWFGRPSATQGDGSSSGTGASSRSTTAGTWTRAPAGTGWRPPTRGDLEFVPAMKRAAGGAAYAGPASGLREGQRPAPVPGDRPAQSLGVDGRGVDAGAAVRCRGAAPGRRPRRPAAATSGRMVPSAIPAAMSSRRSARNASSRSRKIAARSAAVAASAHSSRKARFGILSSAERPDVAVDQPQEPVEAGRHAVKPGHEPALGRVGQALQQRLLGPEVVGDEPAAVPGPLADARQRQRVHPLLDDQLGGGVEQRGLGLVAALLLGAAGGRHGHEATTYLSASQQVLCWRAVRPCFGTPVAWLYHQTV